MKIKLLPFRHWKTHNWVRTFFGLLIAVLAIMYGEYGMMWMGGPLLIAGFFGRRGCHGETCEI